MTYALLALLMLIPATAPAPPVYICPHAAREIVVDGLIDEAEWADAAWTDDFAPLRQRDEAAPKLRTRARVLQRYGLLYIAAEMTDPDVRASIHERDHSLHEETAFEVFIDPDNDGRDYVEIQVNPNGTVLDLLMSRPYSERGKADKAFTIKSLRTAVKVRGTLNDASDRDEGWSVEVAVAIDEINRLAPKGAGSRWRVNFARVWREIDDGEPVYTAWSPTGSSLHAPSRWGWINFRAAK